MRFVKLSNEDRVRTDFIGKLTLREFETLRVLLHIPTDGGTSYYNFNNEVEGVMIRIYGDGVGEDITLCFDNDGILSNIMDY